jgi:hypothetical protein
MGGLAFLRIMQKRFHTETSTSFEMLFTCPDQKLHIFLNFKERVNVCVHWLAILCRVVHVSSLLFSCQLPS